MQYLPKGCGESFKSGRDDCSEKQGDLLLTLKNKLFKDPFLTCSRLHSYMNIKVGSGQGEQKWRRNLWPIIYTQTEDAGLQNCPSTEASSDIRHIFPLELHFAFNAGVH